MTKIVCMGFAPCPLGRFYHGLTEEFPQFVGLYLPREGYLVMLVSSLAQLGRTNLLLAGLAFSVAGLFLRTA